MRLEDILPKEDSFEKLQAVQGKPEKNFIFAPEFNAVVESLKAVKEEVEKPKVEAILTPEFYGAKGDGIENDTAALIECFNNARDKKSPVLLKGTYRHTATLDVSNLILISEGATFLSQVDDYALSAVGTRSNYVRISHNTWEVLKSGSSIKMDSQAQVNSLNLKPGDLIKIRSMGIVFAQGESGSRPGEIQRVHSTDGEWIYIAGNFEHESYPSTVEAQTEIAKINPCTFVNIGKIKVIQGLTNNARGLRLTMVDSPVVDMQFIDCFERSVNLSDVWMAQINIDCQNQIRTGLGYGVAIANATMYCKITGVIQGCRHAITTGGDGERGVSWGNLIHDMLGVAHTLTAIFDTHATSGSTTFLRCIARGNVERHGVIMFGLDPTQIQPGFPDGTPNIPSGFSMEGRYVTIQDCEVHDCSVAVRFSSTNRLNGAKHELIKIDGLHCTNIRNTGVGIVNCDAKALIIKNVTIVNDSFFDISAENQIGVNIGSGSSNTNELDYVEIENIKLVNIQCGVNITGGLVYQLGGVEVPKEFMINNVFLEYTAPQPTSINSYNRLLRLSGNYKMTISNCYSKNVALFNTVSSAGTIPLLRFINCVTEQARTGNILILSPVTELIVENCDFSTDVAGVTIYCIQTTANITRMMVQGCVFRGSNMRGIHRGSATITDFVEGQNMLSGTRFASSGMIFHDVNQLPIRWITSGNTIDPVALKGELAPEGMVVARPGSIYQRRNGEMYLKTTGTGNTGWTIK